MASDTVQCRLHDEPFAGKQAPQHLLHAYIVFHDQDCLRLGRHSSAFPLESLIIAQIRMAANRRAQKSDNMMTIARRANSGCAAMRGARSQMTFR